MPVWAIFSPSNNVFSLLWHPTFLFDLLSFSLFFQTLLYIYFYTPPPFPLSNRDQKVNRYVAFPGGGGGGCIEWGFGLWISVLSYFFTYLYRCQEDYFQLDRRRIHFCGSNVLLVGPGQWLSLQGTTTFIIVLLSSIFNRICLNII
jgi:hypothetical protein